MFLFFSSDEFVERQVLEKGSNDLLFAASQTNSFVSHAMYWCQEIYVYPVLYLSCLLKNVSLINYSMYCLYGFQSWVCWTLSALRLTGSYAIWARGSPRDSLETASVDFGAKSGFFGKINRGREKPWVRSASGNDFFDAGDGCDVNWGKRLKVWLFCDPGMGWVDKE